jgi:hypothetical protein
MHACLHAYVHMCLHTCVDDVYMNRFKYAFIHAYMHMFTCACILFACAKRCGHVYVNICMYTYIHAHGAGVEEYRMYTYICGLGRNKHVCTNMFDTYIRTDHACMKIIHVCIYMYRSYIHTYIHTRMHTHINSDLLHEFYSIHDQKSTYTYIHT